MLGQNRKVKKVGYVSATGGGGGITRGGLRRFPEVVGRVSSLGLLILGFALVNPVPGSEQASALTAEELEAGSAISAVNISFSPTSGTASLTPTTETGVSARTSVKTSVSISNSGGYSIYLSSKTPGLTGRNTGVTIPGVAGDVMFDNLATNTWGYAVVEGGELTADTTYKAMSQGQGDLLKTGSERNFSYDFLLSFAAKIGTDKPADTYENKVTLSVVSSPVQLTLLDIDNLQDMTTAICENTSQLATKQLKDVRDGRYYWVTKLADNNCWMTQNLALDLGSEWPDASLSDYDVASTEYKPVPTENEVIADTIDTLSTSTRSWNLGEYRIVNPTVSNNCGTGNSSIAGCPEQFTPYATPTTANGDELAHYIVGNYYQWNTATAGTGGTITSGEASGSVCPKGWKLPTSNSAASGSFGGLIEAGGIGSDVPKLTSEPYYFVRGGLVYQNPNLYSYFGSNGLYWSSTPAYDTKTAHFLDFYGSGTIFYYDHAYSRCDAYSVRCLAR